jgi:Transposase zinc-binding domain
MDASCPVAQSRREAAQERFTLGDILRAFLPIVLPLLKLGQHHLRVLGQLAACGTLQLGANLFPCPHCGHRHWAPRCCGDRHCPGCQAAKSRQWLAKQLQSLLPVPYYHCVLVVCSM